MKAVVVIPARYQSSRLPGKPLLRETGKYLVQHVYERACLSRRARQVVVATDDRRIEAAVKSFGGQVRFTREDHASGTDRVAEVAEQLEADIIVNLQGDEPLIDPHCLDYVIELLIRHPLAVMSTLATPINSVDQWKNPNCVKVVISDNGQALYFSRSPIPYVRDGEPNFQGQPFQFFQHVGLYAYRRSFLLQLASVPPSSLEQLEKLEQLRVLALGQSISVGIVPHAAFGVDTAEDYQKFVNIYRNRQAKAA